MFYNCLFIATSGYLARHDTVRSNTYSGSNIHYALNLLTVHWNDDVELAKQFFCPYLMLKKIKIKLKYCYFCSIEICAVIVGSVVV